MGKDPGSIPLDDPLALFLTWTTDGSWLAGDDQSWVAKLGRFREPDAKRGEVLIFSQWWGAITIMGLDQVRANLDLATVKMGE